MRNRPLKIAMVVASPFPANHGTPGSIGEMAGAMAQRGHDVHVVTYHFGEGKISERVHIHRIADLGFSRKVVVGPTTGKPLLDLLMVFTLCSVIFRENIDVIHAHNYEGALVGFPARLITGKPLIYNAVNTMSDELETYNFFKPKILGNLLAKALDYWVPRTADRILAISSELVAFLEGRKIESGRIRMIPLGIDMTQFASNGRQEQMPTQSPLRQDAGSRPTVIYTGILDRMQRIDYLIRAMKVVVEAVENARLLLVVNIAKEEDLKEFQALIEELGLRNHVDIVMSQSFDEIPGYLAGADVAVACRPHCPGFPVKLLNYMAAGKAIAAFEGSAKGLQHLSSAFVVKDHDWQALGKGIATLLQQPGLAAELGRRARQWAARYFSWPRIASDIEEVYAELLERHVPEAWGAPESSRR